MGCFSSKILTRSGSFQEQLNQSLHRKSHGYEDLLNSKNGGDQLLALLYTANTVSMKLKECSAQQETANMESVGSLELLPDIENKEKDSEMQINDLQKIEEDRKFVVNICDGKSRSFRTVEDFDAFAAMNCWKENSEIFTELQSKEQVKMEIEEANFIANSEEPKNFDHENVMNMKGSKRKAMARELGCIKVQSFDFSKSGSLREWLRHGGQVFSPGSYTTPRFGNIISSPPNNNYNNNSNNNKIVVDGDEGKEVIFDPDLIEQFEQAMEQLTMEEELIIEQVFTPFEEGNNGEKCLQLQSIP